MAMPGIADSVTGFERNSPDYTDQHNPYICYNGQINPLIPFAIKGVIWAQGESVTWGTGTYRALQVAEIESWRKAWGRDFTFLVTQLSRYGVSSGSWPTLREAQWQATRMVPDAGLAVTIDIGDSANVHYADKQDLGARLGLAALGVAYGLPIDFSGPAYDRMATEGSSLRVYFLNAGKGLSFVDGKSAGFEISPDGKTWTPAAARIDRDSTVLLSASAVSAPKYARYAWAGWPQAGLFSRTDPPLPAIPFRTNAPELPVGVARGSSPEIKHGVRRAGGYRGGRWEVQIPGREGKTADAHGRILGPNR